jgi:carboxypeptidase Taq
MQEELDQLKILLGTAHDLGMAAAVLRWDQETYMPPGGAAARAEQLATLGQLAHEYFTADEVGALLDDLAAHEAELDHDSDEASLIRVTRREYDRARRVPADLVGEIARATSLAQGEWVKARAASDFARFQPALETNIELRQRWASYFDVPDDGHIYDPLLDSYEPGMTTAQVKTVFDGVRPELVELTAAIAANQDAVEDGLLNQPYDEGTQWAFSLELARGLGYDFERGRQDKSAHPFTTSFSIDDVRITSRITPDFPASCWFGTVHETGHALYEQNIDPSLGRTPLGGGTSMAVHESQSRLYENNVARGRPFWEHYFPQAQSHFPKQLGGASLDDFYRAINRSGPSLIRVEADEVTYGLHIILRFELEQAMMAGEVRAADLPELWNAKVQEFLGLSPPNDAQGVLQDIHWSLALFGYFPTYLLGSILAVQVYEAAKAALPGLEDGYTRGEFAPLLGWLRENVHQHGSKFTLPELSERVTGEQLSSEPYADYLRAKFGEVYGL